MLSSIAMICVHMVYWPNTLNAGGRRPRRCDAATGAAELQAARSTTSRNGATAFNTPTACPS
jgi:hypothetical protein